MGLSGKDFRESGFRGGERGLHSLFEAGLVFADLTLDHIDAAIDGGFILRARFLRAEERTADRDGDFCAYVVANLPERDRRVRSSREEPIEFDELLFHVITHVVADVDLSADNVDVHDRTAFLEFAAGVSCFPPPSAFLL